MSEMLVIEAWVAWTLIAVFFAFTGWLSWTLQEERRKFAMLEKVLWGTIVLQAKRIAELESSSDDKPKEA